MAPRLRKNPWALSGVLFVVLFIWGLVLGGILSSDPFPMPGAPAPEVARYYSDNGTAVLASGLLQALSSLSLLVFAFHVTTFVRRTAAHSDNRDAPAGTVLAGGALAAGLLFVSALLSWMLVLVAPGSLDLVATLRNLNFITGGAAHVASLGVFVGVASISSSKKNLLPRWIPWLGIVAAALSLLSLASLAWFPATYLIPLGRLLSFIWVVAVSILLVLGWRNKAGRGR
jgi:hypothetical protein